MPGRVRAKTLLVLLLICCSVLTMVSTTPSDATAQPADTVTFGDLAAIPSFPDAEILLSFSATATEEITRVELLFNAVGEETLHLITPDTIAGTSVDVEFGLDMFQNYYPPGLDLEYRWRVTGASGTVTESETQIVSWYDTRYEWTSISSEQVTVYSYDTNNNFAAEILASAQGTIDELQALFGVERSLPMRIWVYDSQDDLGGATEPNSEPWIAGVSYPGRFLILAAIPDGNSMELRRVIPHEVSHQVLFQATENPFNLPATWLDEGLATYNQDIGSDSYVALIEQAVDDDAIMPIPTLNTSFPYDDSFQLAYAESYSVISFIIQTFGEAALGDVLTAYKDGVSHDEAVRRGLGISIDELDHQWQASLGDGGDGTGGGTIGFNTVDWINGIMALALLIAVPAMAVRLWRSRGSAYPDNYTDGMPA